MTVVVTERRAAGTSTSELQAAALQQPLPGSAPAAKDSSTPSVFELLLLLQTDAPPATKTSSANESKTSTKDDDRRSTPSAPHSSRTSSAVELSQQSASTPLNLMTAANGVINSSNGFARTNTALSTAHTRAASFARSANAYASPMPSSNRTVASSTGQASSSTSDHVSRQQSATVEAAFEATTKQVDAESTNANMNADVAKDVTANTPTALPTPAPAEVPVNSPAPVFPSTPPQAATASQLVTVVPTVAAKISGSLTTTASVVRLPSQGVSLNGMSNSESLADITVTHAVEPTSHAKLVQSDDSLNNPGVITLPGVSVSVNNAAPVTATLSEQIATAINTHLHDESTTAGTSVRIRLERPDLGKIDLHISTHHDMVNIRIVTQDAASQQIIDRQLQDLRQSLSNSGVTLGQFRVSCDANDRSSSGQSGSDSTRFWGSSNSSRWSRSSSTATPSPARPMGRLNFVA